MSTRRSFLAALAVAPFAGLFARFAGLSRSPETQVDKQVDQQLVRDVHDMWKSPVSKFEHQRQQAMIDWAKRREHEMFGLTD